MGVAQVLFEPKTDTTFNTYCVFIILSRATLNYTLTAKNSDVSC